MAAGKALNEETNFDMGANITFIENADKYSVSKTVQFAKVGNSWRTNENMKFRNPFVFVNFIEELSQS